MQCSRRSFLALCSLAAAAVPLAGCSGQSNGSGTCDVPLDKAAWHYDSDNDIYYQIGAVYCAKPQASDYESCAIYVPGAYMDAKANSDGSTYTCTPKKDGKVGDFTAGTAPIVMPINTGGYAAQAAPTSYDATGLDTYMKAGLVYVYSGCRGKNNGTDSSGNVSYPGGAPWGVTDLKACVRFLRGNSSLIPGSTDRIFTFGHSGGGAQSSLMGASGDSELYTPYLDQIGAVTQDKAGNKISDAVFGSMCWCPVTSLDYANEAYEWNMGQFVTTGTRADGTFTKALSTDLASSYAGYLNQLGLKDDHGTALALSRTDSGVYLAGTYYDHLVSVIEKSLNNFLADTTFPYTPNSSVMADGGFPGSGSSGGMGGMGARTGGMPQTGAAASGSAPSTGAATSGGAPSTDAAASGAAPSTDAAAGGLPSGGLPSGTLPSGGMPSGMAGGGMMGGSSTAVGTDSSTTYNTVADYIAALNANVSWVTYDAATNTARITGLADFSTQCKQPSKDVCAFDSLGRTQAENSLFCTPSQAASHFDPTIESLLEKNAGTYEALSGWNASYPSDYKADLALTDSQGKSMEYRMNAYNPMYYLCGTYKGFGTSKVAEHWRINTGIDQGDTALTVEANLALALGVFDGVKDVSFTTVWGKAHTPAERTGSAADNLISWIRTCCQ